MATATAVDVEREIIEKGPRGGVPERIEVCSEAYHGHDLIHARIHYQGGEGEWLPSPRGLSLPPELAAKVAEAMLKCARQQLGEES